MQYYIGVAQLGRFPGSIFHQKMRFVFLLLRKIMLREHGCTEKQDIIKFSGSQVQKVQIPEI